MTSENSLAPRKRSAFRELDRLYLAKINRSYRKVTDGKNLFPKLQPEAALSACPHLKNMVEEMVRLAQEFQLDKQPGKKRF
jgi:hypothetical protein